MNPIRWLIILLSLACATAWAQGKQIVEADRIVALVNDEVITQVDLNGRLVQVERQLAQQKTPLPDRGILARQLLERMIVERLQLQLARETSTRVDDPTVDRALGRIADANRLSMSQFRGILERDGINWDQFREDIRNEILMARVREREVDNRVVVSEGEIDHYLAGPERSVAAEELLVSHILLRAPEQASPERLAQLRARADQALGELKRGADFAQVAASYSDAPDGLTGGSLGWRSAERLPALFAETLTRMQAGDISEVVRSPAGFHIVKLVQRRGGTLTGKRLQQTRARHILIKTSEIVSDDEAKRKLLILKERLDNGGDFAEIARLHSADITGSKGGDLGWLYAGDAVPEFEQAMDQLKPGEISGPVQTPYGWHLIQVQERRVDEASSERQRMVARQAVKERKAEESYQDWLRQLRDRAYVEYRLDQK